jgi:hypothetical protein
MRMKATYIEDLSKHMWKGAWSHSCENYFGLINYSIVVNVQEKVDLYK